MRFILNYIRQPGFSLLNESDLHYHVGSGYLICYKNDTKHRPPLGMDT
jgi:hypothetical protein